jgi:pimeloyl-ACP methyl ester carboxylesterase
VDIAAAIEPPVREELLAVPLPDGARLALRRFHRGDGGPVLLHGAIENGRIFYSRSGRGLAPFLAREGFDAFVADLRGRGDSQPPIGPRSSHGQTESIVEECCVPGTARWGSPALPMFVATNGATGVRANAGRVAGCG